MNRTSLITLVAIAALAIGIAAGMMLGGDGPDPGTSAAPPSEQREILYWVAPMDPNFRRDAPGKSPMGMDLVPVYADQVDNGGDVISINPTVVNNLGVRTERAEIRPLWRRVEATGYVAFDETRITHVNLRTQGWIVKLLVNAEGERVAEGELLFELYSPELVNAQKEYLQAQQRGAARMLSGAEEKLRALGMIRSDITRLAQTQEVSDTIQVVAPQDGVVSELNVREGVFVMPNTTVMSLADLSSVWLMAEVFESQADWVAPGQSAEARLDYMPGHVFSGQVDYVYPVLDPTTRTLRVRLHFDNPMERLKPNMYARVTIFGSTQQAALSIPREALIRAPGNDRVVVALDDGRFRVHEVMTGLESGDRVEIITGIEAGDEVVTSAQFLIDSEASLRGSFRRLGPTQEAMPADEPEAVFASGLVQALDQDARRILISHGPIDALGWPAMTMEFKVLPGVPLERVHVGQNIHFSIHPEPQGSYVVNTIHLDDPGAAEGQQEESS